MSACNICGEYNCDIDHCTYDHDEADEKIKSLTAENGELRKALANKEKIIEELLAEKFQKPFYECPACNFDNFPAFQRMQRLLGVARDALLILSEMPLKADKIKEYRTIAQEAWSNISATEEKS